MDVNCEDQKGDFNVEYHSYEYLDDAREPKLFEQADFNDLARDLSLSKHDSEVLGSRLRERNLLATETKTTVHRKRSADFSKYYDKIDNLCFCVDIVGLMSALFEDYESSEWRLFVDGSVNSLKAVLLHIGNVQPSIPVGHASNMKESHDSMKTLLMRLKYKEHNWVICGDLKVVALLLGMQLALTKFSCFLCLWDSRARDQHYKKTVWPHRAALEIGENNVVNEALVDRNKILLPPLHIKLGLFKQFVKALDKKGAGIQFLKRKFPRVRFFLIFILFSTVFYNKRAPVIVTIFKLSAY
jgi:hypothetical protein